MKAIFPGSFNPWHEGHEDVLKKIIPLFSSITITIGKNDIKEDSKDIINRILFINSRINYRKFIHYTRKDINVTTFNGLLKDYINKTKPDCIIRGLRNGKDFQYELEQQYWNEDLGINIPTLYIITDRKLSHISSSAIRMVNKLKGV